MSRTAQLATKGRKILQCKYTSEHKLNSTETDVRELKKHSNAVALHKITEVNHVRKYVATFIHL
jgi:hypothetical protein